MQISKISGFNRYQTKSVAMKGKRADKALIKKFDNFMYDNDLFLKVEIVPIAKKQNPVMKAQLFHCDEKTGKEDLLLVRNVNKIPHLFTGIGSTLDEAKLHMIKQISGYNLAIINNPQYKSSFIA
ncbi:hypothetical protein IJS77_02555 [bacterium]|nr:hypothetical protein [bacterium]